MKGKILIVDDDNTIRQGLKTLLLADYYDVVAAENGEKAVELFQKEIPDLVVLDVGLPDMDGFEVLKRIKKNMRDRYIPVIFLTASVEMENKIKAFHSGAVDYLTKPFSTAELLVRIENFLKIKRQHDILQDESTHDKMTGAWNKASFTKKANEEIRKAFVYKKPLALIMADIDDFKKINDTHGHLAGDQVIVGFSTRIKSIVRPTDVLGRFGGDEFALLLPNTNVEGAILIVKRLIEKIQKTPVMYEDKELPLSVSIGIADTSQKEIHNLDELVKLADGALYEAKKTKGNSYAAAQ